MNQKRLLVWTLGTISAGEISIAVKFTRSLSEEMFDVMYLIPEHYKNVLPPGTKCFTLDPEDNKHLNKEKITSLINDYSPDFFFLSDPYTAHFASAWTGYSYTDIKALGIPVIGLDEYDMKKFKRKKDYYGGKIVSDRDLIEECDYLLQDVPVNPLVEECDDRTFKYSLFEKADIDITNKKPVRQEVNETLGLDEDCKLIMLPVSTWESVNMHRFSILEGFIENLLELVLFYLDELKLRDKVCLLHVGKQKISYNSTGSVIYKNVKSMDSELYEKCIVSCDVFMSFNAVSVSLSRAILNRVPSVLMVNEKVLNFEMLEETVQKLPQKYGDIVRRIRIAYPFYASTFGWRKFINPIVENNDYYELFKTVPVFSFSKMKTAIAESLDYERYYSDKTEKLDDYIRLLMQLESPDKIMMKICDKQKELMNGTD